MHSKLSQSQSTYWRLQQIYLCFGHAYLKQASSQNRTLQQPEHWELPSIFHCPQLPQLRTTNHREIWLIGISLNSSWASKHGNVRHTHDGNQVILQVKAEPIRERSR